MRKTILAAAAVAAFLAFGSPPNRVEAMPLASPAALGTTELSPVQDVRWGWRRHYWGRPWIGPYWGWRRPWIGPPVYGGWRRHYWAGPYGGPYWGRPYWGRPWGPY